MDFVPLLIGAAVGAGDSAIGHYSRVAHKFLLYRAAVFAAGLFGEVSGKLSPDVSYGLMVAGSTLIAQDIPGALSGGGLASFGLARTSDSLARNTAYNPAYYGLTEVIPSSTDPLWNPNRKIAQVPNTQPATAAG